jgi:stage V sporulation protein R
MAPIPQYLRELQTEIQGYADHYGLDYFMQVFEIVDYRQMCEIASYTGFPVRYPHWRFGMEYDHMLKSHTYGLSKVYELVINTDPCYAYLLEGNSQVDQKLVMAHVYGHNDFFKNNYYFSRTDRRVIDVMANSASRVRRYMDRHGVSAVESFIDTVLSLDNLIDPWAPFRDTQPKRKRDERVEDNDDEVRVGRLESVRGYLEDYVNPPSFIEAQKAKRKQQQEASKRKIPLKPERDVLGFLIQHAPLDSWEADVLGIIREEAYYFLPQMQTKIMNVVSSVFSTAPGQLNPYKLGVELFRNIEDRWNKGKFGPEWDRCDNLQERLSWDKQLGLGRQKVFEVRRLYNDVTFIDEFFTIDFCRDEKFFTFTENRRSGRLEIETREFEKVKSKLLQQLTNFGQPFIYVVDANYLNRGELLLGHRHEGRDLKLDYARDTLRNLERVWRRPTSILTVIDDKPKRIRFDGSEVTISDEPEAFRV